MQRHLTAIRLSSVHTFFQTSSDTDLLGCYAWNQAVASGLLPILGDFEVALRNTLHAALSQHYKTDDWMMTALLHPSNPQTPRKYVQAKHKMTPRSLGDIFSVIDKIKQRKGQATPNDVIAALTFGFWEQLIKSLDHRSHPKILQETILKSALPHAPDTAKIPYSSPQFKDRVTKLLACIRDVRNRIGHHDSLWTTPEFDEHGKVGFFPRRPRHSVNSLRLLAERLCWLMGWIDPAIPAYIRKSDHWYSYQALLSREALAIYRSKGGYAGSYQAVLDAIAPPARRTSRHRPAFLERLKHQHYIGNYHY